MEKISKNFVNELLKKLGHENISVVEKPIFYWNGNSVTDDETAPVKQVSSFILNEKLNFSNFFKNNFGKKIVLVPTPDGKLVSDDNEIRVFIG